jgi:hypothetical protein
VSGSDLLPTFVHWRDGTITINGQVLTGVTSVQANMELGRVPHVSLELYAHLEVQESPYPSSGDGKHSGDGKRRWVLGWVPVVD